MTYLLTKFVAALVISAVIFVDNASAGDRLLATGGVAQLEGAGGGGLTPWALISGYGTDKQLGGGAFYTQAKTDGEFDIHASGLAVGYQNKFEVSLSKLKLGLGTTVAGKSIQLDTLGFKMRLYGDAIYDQDTWMPQISAGIQFKHNEQFELVPKLLGAKHADGIDYYVAATKLNLAAVSGYNLLWNLTLRATKANQYGLLGFGGDRNDDYEIKPEVSVAVMLKDNLVAGVEYRAKPDNIGVYKEEGAKDLFVAWFPVKNLSITTAYVDLGNVADKANQKAWYISSQLAF